MTREQIRERLAELERQIEHLDRELQPLCPMRTRAGMLQTKRAALTRERRELAGALAVRS